MEQRNMDLTSHELDFSIGRARKFIADELKGNPDYKSFLLNLAKRSGVDLTTLSDLMAEIAQNTFKINPDLTEINFKQVAEDAIKFLNNEDSEQVDREDPEDYSQYADEYAETEVYNSLEDQENAGIHVRKIG